MQNNTMLEAFTKSSSYNSHSYIKKLKFIFSAICRYAQSKNKAIEDLEILDFGCGKGGVTFPLASLGCRVMAFDIDPSGISLISERVHKENLSNTMIHTGPPISKKENAEEFIKKWRNSDLVIKKPYIKDDRWYVEIKRQYVDVKNFLENEFKKLSLGKHIDKIVNNKYLLLDMDDLLSENFVLFWTDYLDEKMSWER